MNEKIRIYLKEFIDNTQNNIDGALLLRKNGQLVYAILPDEIDKEKVALIGTILVSSCERACDELNKGNLKQIMVEGDFGKIILISHGNNEFIGALSTFKANNENTLTELKRTSELMKH